MPENMNVKIALVTEKALDPSHITGKNKIAS
jgi:hypothetical protein